MHTQVTSIRAAMDRLPEKQKVLVLTGPTAVGKTNISLALAEALNGEIISADSVQVYRGLDVGSDKIPPKQRRGVPHHLLDILEADEDFSAGDFYTLARKAAADILSRGKTPIVTGGTGFYLRWFILGKANTPRSSPESERKAQAVLDEAFAAHGDELTSAARWDIGCELVRTLGDPVSADRLREEVNNMYRLRRIVDILLQTDGIPLADQDLNKDAPSDYDFRCYFLHRPRLELYRRIDERVESIVSEGLLEEAIDMFRRGILPATHGAARAIGYRQALDFISQCMDQGEVTETDVLRLVTAVQNATRELCKKQLNWFRDDTLFLWMDAQSEQLVEDILQQWNSPAHIGGCGDSGRLTHEQNKEMKRYQTELKMLRPGSQAIDAVVRTARQLLFV